LLFNVFFDILHCALLLIFLKPYRYMVRYFEGRVYPFLALRVDLQIKQNRELPLDQPPEPHEKTPI